MGERFNPQPSPEKHDDNFHHAEDTAAAKMGDPEAIQETPRSELALNQVNADHDAEDQEEENDRLANELYEKLRESGFFTEDTESSIFSEVYSYVANGKIPQDPDLAKKIEGLEEE